MYDRIQCFFVFLIGLSIANVAYADERTGFMLRFNVGLGYSDTSRDLGGNVGQLSINGLSTLGQFAVGGFIRPNLALHATFFSLEIDKPTVEDGRGDVRETEESDLKMTLSGVGLGLCYYFMPSNVYLSASIGLGRATTKFYQNERRSDEESKDGFHFTSAVSKEWPVHEDWSLGVGGQFNYALLPVRVGADCFGSCDQDLQSFAGGIFFSATYN